MVKYCPESILLSDFGRFFNYFFTVYMCVNLIQVAARSPSADLDKNNSAVSNFVWKCMHKLSL